jgi:hypothetical protein
MLPGDVEVEPVSMDQLAELAQQYPDEYAAKAKAAGIDPSKGSGRLGKLLNSGAKEIVRQIGEMSADNDKDFLWEIFEAENADEEENGSGKQRKTVLEALAAKGIKD